MPNLSLLLFSACAVTCLAACGDPIHDTARAELGAEVWGVPAGELHRPGQPCVLCHSQEGGDSVFTLAGTIYLDPVSTTPVEDVDVLVVDSRGRRFSARTNCAGNFFVRPEQFTPDFPIWIGLERGEVFRDMDTPVYREGSCAGCHSDPKGLASAGHVYLIEDLAEEMAPPTRCRQ